MDECDDLEAKEIQSRVEVIYKEVPEDWYTLGGLVTGESPTNYEPNTYFYQKW